MIVKLNYSTPDGGWQPCKITLDDSIETQYIYRECAKELTKMGINFKTIALGMVIRNPKEGSNETQ